METQDELANLPTETEPPALHFRNALGESVAYSLEGKQRVSIGRDASCDLVLDDHEVSRLHATIDLVGDDQHLLRDAGSSNGTFLNGLRLSGESVFSLREGDVIELGRKRLTYGRERTAADEAPSGGSFDLGDLLRDGFASLETPERTALQLSVQQAFQRVSRPIGLERSLEIVAARLRVQGVAIFLAHGRGLRPVVGRPKLDASGPLAALAHRAWTTREGCLVRSLHGFDGGDGSDTFVASQSSLAGLPLAHASKTMGAIAVERTLGGRLDRSDLALLAVMADRIAFVYGLELASADDTRPGTS